MNTDQKISLVRQVGEEIITEDDLRKLLESGQELVAYDGFEPSGQIHIAQGLLRAINVNKMIKAGCRFKMLVADWHAMANNKMGGDLDRIQTVGRYFIEVWKACGMDLSKVEFIWASEMVKNPEYWKLVIQVGRTNSLRRFIRTAEMMGRSESLEALTGANIIYSCMQVADIFMLNAKITQLGMDQRKLNMLAREIGPQLGYWKPVVVSHHMLLGLVKPNNPERVLSEVEGRCPHRAIVLSEVEGRVEGSTNKLTRTIALKMSKSNPDSAIFMTDSTEDIKRKINKAYCPEGVAADNPVLEYCKYIIFEAVRDADLRPLPLTIERPEKFGGTITINSYGELERKFAAKEIHPADLKQAVTQCIDTLLQPIRNHFEKNEAAKALLEAVKGFSITR